MRQRIPPVVGLALIAPLSWAADHHNWYSTVGGHYHGHSVSSSTDYVMSGFHLGGGHRFDNGCDLQLTLLGHYIDLDYTEDSYASEALLSGRIPLGPMSWRQRVFLDLSLGLFYSHDRVPPNNGTFFNFTEYAGIGYQHPLSASTDISLIVRYQHLSNAGIGGQPNTNPGIDASSLSLGLVCWWD
ncbi:MAG: acyloxyacyl hydrolase [Planctomycetota bacterium]|jgi:opacity protein-like surface antigen